MNSTLSLALHGGAGVILRENISAEVESAYRSSMAEILTRGFAMLQAGATALDTVEATVLALEDNPLFNAGRGSVFTRDGTHEMDATLMDGATLRAGTVSAVRNVRNPIALCRAIMDRSEHVFLTGEGAERFARELDLAFEPDDYFFTQARYDQLLNAQGRNRVQLDHTPPPETGTVGAVALDTTGHLAAATSTGGMTNKRPGRVGDSAGIGGGTYANDATCAVSCTGVGEAIMRAMVAYDISALMEYRGLPLQDACDVVMNGRLTEIGGSIGLVAVDRSGSICMPFNSPGMYRGAIGTRHSLTVGIWRE